MSDHPGLPMILRSVCSDDILRVNGAFTDALGWTGDELADEPFLEWIHAEDQASLAQAFDSGQGHARARHRSKLGDWLAFDWEVKSATGGTVARGLLWREPADDNRETLVRPPEARTTLAATLDAMALIVEAQNPRLRCSILLVDANKERIIGGAGPNLPRAYNEAVEGLVIGPAVGSCGTAAYWNVPVVVESIADDPLWKDLRGVAAIANVAACWSFPITATNGDVLGALALYDDVPSTPTQRQIDGLEIAARMVGLAVERERLEQQLHQAAKMEAIGVLAGGVAHDFNNMLATVLGNAELALTTLEDEAAASPMLHDIVTASMRATDLCNQMLAYAGRGALVPETLECNAIVTELGGLLKVALSKKATLRYELQDASLCVLADRSQLRQVFMNLITNASEAIGDNEGRIVVATKVRTYTRDEIEVRFSGSRMEPGDYVVVQISDTGVGMSPETQAKIFDPFFTTKSAGRGLGLAAVQGIVRGHNGALALTSAAGRGTTITVLLPRVLELAAMPEPAPMNGGVAQGARILVVDDEPNVQKVLAAMLERAGYSVLTANDGPEAIDLFRAEGDTIDCVLLDLSMPKLGGDEVFRELRAIREDVCVILSSGFTEEEMMSRFHGAGLSGAVQKPAPMNVLLACVSDALRQAAAAR